MTECDRFELDLADALRDYAEEASTRVSTTELARHFATAYPRRRTRLGPWRVVSPLRLAWLLLLLAGLLIAMLGGLFLAGSQPEPKLSVVAPVYTCPPGTNPDEPGPADQARPGALRDLWTMAFDRRAGQIIIVTKAEPGSASETWTFDVCTNTWTQMDSTPPEASLYQLVYDIDSDVTIGASYSLVWAYDLQADTWTEKRAAPTDVTSLTYDPVSGLVVAWSYGEPWSYDVETDTWTAVEQANSLGDEAGYLQFVYDTSVDRFIGYAGPYETPMTVLFDLRTGAWSKSEAETPVLWGGWHDMAPYVAFDEAAERTVVTGAADDSFDMYAYAYDAAADRWDGTTLETGADLGVDPQSIAYDPVDQRLVVYGFSGQMTALDTLTGDWIVLLEPAVEQPAPSPE